MRAWVTINKNDSLSKAARSENKVGRGEERKGEGRRKEKKIRAHAVGKSQRARTVVFLRQRHIAPSYVIHY